MSNPKMTPQMIKEATERVAQGLDVLKYRAETGGLTAEEQTELTRLLDRLSQLDDVMTEAEIELQQKKIQLDAGVVFPTKRPDALRSPPDRGATSDAGLVFPVPQVGIPMSMDAPTAATSASSTAGPHITIQRPPAASAPSEMPPQITIRRPAPEAPSGVSSQRANAPATVLDTLGLRTADETLFVADSDAPTAPSLGSGLCQFASPAEKRDAPTIFYEGLGNLAKEPLGWLDGAKPSPLRSSLPVDVATSEARKPVSVGDRVLTELGDEGYVRFIGETSFNPGVWVGVALLEPKGKHDGTVEGVRYFECPPDHGLFARAQKLTPLGEGDSGADAVAASAPALCTGSVSMSAAISSSAGAAISSAGPAGARPAVTATMMQQSAGRTAEARQLLNPSLGGIYSPWPARTLPEGWGEQWSVPVAQAAAVEASGVECEFTRGGQQVEANGVANGNGSHSVTDLPVSVYVSSQAGDRRIAKNCRWAVDFLVGKKVPHAVVDLAVRPEMRSRLEALCLAAGSPLAGVKGLTPLTGGDEHERGLPMVDIRGQRTITHYEMQDLEDHGELDKLLGPTIRAYASECGLR